MGIPAEQALLARDLVARASAPVAVSDLVVAETYFALLHHYSVPHSDAVNALAALLSDPRVEGSGVALAVLTNSEANAPKAKPGLIDRLIHADYSQQSLDVATFDPDFARLRGATLVERK